jgi:hypothetical protein
MRRRALESLMLLQGNRMTDQISREIAAPLLLLLVFICSVVDLLLFPVV